ncbi:MAG: hypothetical protein M9953_00365 [Thermomicrobiales bacterium]|nr:hypothetical protein [Thermomicrobiales bacterium]
MTNSGHLASWVDGGAKSRIQAFLADITNEDGDGFIPVDERIAVFDNDGTLWPEQPLLAQIAFTIDRFAELTAERPELAKIQPYKAAAEGDLDWFGNAVTRYYQGDPSDMLILMKALPTAFYGFTVEQYQQRAVEFFRRRSIQPGAPICSVGVHPDGGTSAISGGA